MPKTLQYGIRSTRATLDEQPAPISTRRAWESPVAVPFVVTCAQCRRDVLEADQVGDEEEAELGVRPLPPLVLQAGHVGEVVPPDEPVARVDGLSEVDDGPIPFVVVVVADRAFVPTAFTAAAFAA